MLEDLRKARPGETGTFPIETALADKVVFFSDIDKDNEAEKVSYFLEAGTLKKSIIQVKKNPVRYDEVDKTTETIARQITNDGEIL